MLDGELDDILSHVSEVNAKRLLIESWNLAPFDVSSLLSAAGAPSVTEFTIITDLDNHHQKKCIHQIRDELQAKNGIFTLKASSQRKLIRILVDNYCLIEGSICYANTIYQRPIFSFHGTITFEQSTINAIWMQYRS